MIQGSVFPTIIIPRAFFSFLSPFPSPLLLPVWDSWVLIPHSHSFPASIRFPSNLFLIAGCFFSFSSSFSSILATSFSEGQKYDFLDQYVWRHYLGLGAIRPPLTSLSKVMCRIAIFAFGGHLRQRKQQFLRYIGKKNILTHIGHSS